MKTFRINRSQRGFSMIEVMISIVVLGFGLLALAALQTSVIRSSSDTKAQTLALQLAKEKIEDIRAFETLAGYQAISTGTEINPINFGGVSFSRSWGVQRWAYNPDPLVNAFQLLGTETGPTPAGYVENNEVKLVSVTVSWTDANGTSQSVGLEDGIGALSPGDGSKVVLNNQSTSQARKPQVLIYDPGATGGVIPIAVGNGSSTAASNPTPVIKGKDNDVAETLFEVLTYAGTSGNVLAQARVETAVIGCTCSTAKAPSATTARGYRPTFWNGYRYSPPNPTTDKPTAGWTEGASESTRCTACCRDHRDPTGVTGAKFDPWRATHTHYLRSGSTLTVASTGSYNEACRLIRVDGFFRVAADLRNDHFGFLEANNSNDLTNTNQNLRAYAPRVDTVNAANDAKKNYQSFVLKYMDDRFSNNTAYTYNVALNTSSYETTYGLNNPVDSNSIATPIPLKPTAFIPSKNSANVLVGNDSKWSHVRGMYIDWIEPETLDVIKQARNNCTNKTTQLLRNGCVLPYVPFTSVNLTELADYKSRLTTTATTDDVNTVKVTNNAFYDPTNSNIPTRGNVYKGSNPTKDNKAFALSYLTESNSGVALKLAIDTDEVELKDFQEYIIATGSPPAVTDINFTLIMNGHRNASPFPTVIDATTAEPCGPDAFYPTTVACALSPDANGNMQLKLDGYSKASSVTVTNGCDTLNAGSNPNPNANVSMPIILDYNVASAVNSTSGLAALISTPTSNGTTSDSTLLTFASIAANNILVVTFTGPVRYCPKNYSPTINNKIKIGDDDPYGGKNTCTTGGTPLPKWSSDYVTCPSGTP